MRANVALQPLQHSHTFLSVDIVKSTQLIGELEVEAARELLEKGLRIIVDVVYQYGGHILYTAGDGAVAEFKSLSTYENHVLLAIAAGLAIQQQVEEAALPYQLRVGIDTVEIHKKKKKEDGYEFALIIQEHTPAGCVYFSESSKSYLQDELSSKLKHITLEIKNHILSLFQLKKLPASLKKEIQIKLSDLVLASKKKQENIGEIKFISIIFISIDNSKNKLDDKNVAGYTTKIKEILKDYNATLIKSRGLFMMAVLGAPIAYEDHAIRACLVAHRVLKIAEDLKLPNLAKLGINSGPTVVDDIGSQHFHQYDAMGPAVNFAARLEQLAKPGQALLSEETAELVGDAVKLNKLQQQSIRGFKGEYTIYSLESIEQVYISQKLEWEFYSSQIFIDHVAELTMFEEKLALLGTEAVMWGIKAEPGIGKSRLTYEFSKIATKKGVRLLIIGALSYQKNTPFSLLRQFFMRVMNIEAAYDTNRKKQIIVKFLEKNDITQAYDIDALFSVFGFETSHAWHALSAKESLNIIAVCFYHILKSVVIDKPIILAFDDMHWCDEQSLSIFFHAFSHLTNEPIFVMMSYRPEFHESFTIFQKQETELQPLSLHDSRDFMDNLFGDNDGAYDIKERIIKQSEGNPFYMEEIARYLINNNILIKKDSSYAIKSADVSYQIPETIYGVISGSIDRLSTRNKQLLQQASILGDVFALSDLQMLTELSDHELALHLKELEEARLIFTKELFPETQYAFKHAYILDVTYKMMLTKNRIAYHRKFVLALEKFSDINQKLSALAYHSFQANLWKSSFLYYVRLISKQISIDYPISKILIDANKADIAYSHLSDKEKNEYFDDYAIIKMKQFHAMMAGGHMFETIEPLQVLAEQAVNKKNDWVQSLALAHLMVLHALLNASFTLPKAYEDVIKLGKKALKYKHDIDVDNYMATLYFARILYDSIHADYKSFEVNSIPIFNSIKIPNAPSLWLGLPLWSVCRLLNIIALRERMQLTKENAHLDELEEAVKDQAATESTSNNNRSLGIAYLFFGDLEKSKKYFLQALEDSERSDYIVHYPILDSFLGMVYMLEGQHDKAVIYAKKSYEASKKMNHMFFGLSSMGRVASVLLHYKNFSFTNAVIEEALPLAEHADQKPLCIELYQIKADLLIARYKKPDAEKVMELLKKAELLVKQTGAIYFYPYIQRSYARLYQKLANTNKAEKHWQNIFHFFDEYPADFWRDYFAREYDKK